MSTLGGVQGVFTSSGRLANQLVKEIELVNKNEMEDPKVGRLEKLVKRIEIGEPKAGNLMKMVETGDVKVEELVKKIQMNDLKVERVVELCSDIHFFSNWTQHPLFIGRKG